MVLCIVHTMHLATYQHRHIHITNTCPAENKHQKLYPQIFRETLAYTQHTSIQTDCVSEDAGERKLSKKQFVARNDRCKRSKNVCAI